MKQLKNVYYKVMCALMLTLAPAIALAEAVNKDADLKLGTGDDGAKLTESIGVIANMMFSILKYAISIIRMGATMIAFVFAVLGFFMGSNYVKKKAEQNNGQEAPSVIRIGVPLVGAVGGIAVVFVVVGLFGRVFLDLSMTDSWTWAVTSVLSQASK